jgi:predicted amidohydrolase
VKAAVVQINSTTDAAANLAAGRSQVEGAALAGAELVVLPEKWPYLAEAGGILDGAEGIDGPAVTAASEWAREFGVALVAGSMCELAEDGSHTNTSVLIGPDGEIRATYRKLHMFDVEVDGKAYRESAFEDPGSEVIVAECGEARIGMAVCYDLRFPELFREMAALGANVFTLPAAFTPTTGRDHWEVLLRARAIENQAFVLAAAQFGEAEPGYGFWGHSMIIDPWGSVLARVEEGEGFAAAQLDFDFQQGVRSRLPALAHRRTDLFPTGAA